MSGLNDLTNVVNTEICKKKMKMGWDYLFVFPPSSKKGENVQQQKNLVIKINLYLMTINVFLILCYIILLTKIYNSFLLREHGDVSDYLHSQLYKRCNFSLKIVSGIRKCIIMIFSYCTVYSMLVFNLFWLCGIRINDWTAGNYTQRREVNNH